MLYMKHHQHQYFACFYKRQMHIEVSVSCIISLYLMSSVLCIQPSRRSTLPLDWRPLSPSPGRNPDRQPRLQCSARAPRGHRPACRERLLKLWPPCCSNLSRYAIHTLDSTTPTGILYTLTIVEPHLKTNPKKEQPRIKTTYWMIDSFSSMLSLLQ